MLIEWKWIVSRNYHEPELLTYAVCTQHDEVHDELELINFMIAKIRLWIIHE